jgi:uncharacterized membrane protein YphA (DoxX/SURF4 family)
MNFSHDFMWHFVPVAIAASIFIVALLLEFAARKSAAVKKLINVLKSAAFLDTTILAIGTGILLIIAGWQNFLFIPAFSLSDSLTAIIIRYGQIIIGIGLILGIFLRLFTFGILALYVAAFFLFPPLKVLDYLIFAGIAIFLFLVHRDALSYSFFFHPVEKKGFFDRFRKYSLPVLRYAAGLGLAYAAFHHYIFDPQAAVEFLNQRPLLNFMQSIFGIETYTHAQMVFQIGVLGIATGLLFAFGILERVVAIIIAFCLLFAIFIMGMPFLPIAIPYFVVIFIVITGNLYEEREVVAKP